MNIKDKVLVVEDEKGISGFIRAILTANGYDVILAHTGAEAFSMISSHCPDLIVLDLGLPDMDGMNIISAVRQWTQIPIVVVSARTYERDKVEALDKGADDYITKPFGADKARVLLRVAIPMYRAAERHGEQQRQRQQQPHRGGAAAVRYVQRVAERKACGDTQGDDYRTPIYDRASGADCYRIHGFTSSGSAVAK